MSITHMVVFNLKSEEEGGAGPDAFFAKAEELLWPIPHATNITRSRQTNAMCPYEYGFSFDFDSQSDYDAYNTYPDHLKFVEEWWKTQVSGFMEIDFSS
jgi:hypothetical protein